MPGTRLPHVIDRLATCRPVSPAAADRGTTPDYLGAGRSGRVYRTRADAGNERIVRKVFVSSGLTKLVQRVILGVPNPYAWNEHAIRAAVLRRQVLAPLVDVWFAGRVRVARAVGYAWNEAYRAFELHAEYVDGHSVRLRHDHDPAAFDEYEDLVANVLRPLQRHLLEAGFDGSAWQAGLGNPQAVANFLRSSARDGSDRATWVWIDLESGIPNVVPFSPWTFVRHVLPRTIRQRRPLFDDVDRERLGLYLKRRGRELLDHLGVDEYCALRDRIDLLAFHQESWRAPSRASKRRARLEVESSRGAARRANDPSSEMRGIEIRGADEEGKAPPPLPNRRHRPVTPVPRTVRIEPGIPESFARSRDHVAERILAWHDRGHLDAATAASWGRALSSARPNGPIAKLGPQCRLESSLMTATAAGIGAAVGSGAAGLPVLGASAVGLAALPAAIRIGRTLSALRHPGRSAADDAIARFALYDAAASIGRVVPIVGGPDSALEHRCNRLANRLVPARLDSAPPMR